MLELTVCSIRQSVDEFPNVSSDDMVLLLFISLLLSVTRHQLGGPEDMYTSSQKLYRVSQKPHERHIG